MNRSIGDSVLAASACFFGIWTVYCYAMVLSASSFSDLMAWSFVPLVIALGLWAVCTGKVQSSWRGGQLYLQPSWAGTRTPARSGR